MTNYHGWNSQVARNHLYFWQSNGKCGKYNFNVIDFDLIVVFVVNILLWTLLEIKDTNKNRSIFK